MTARYLLGCDVGTGSVRAGIFDVAGTLVAATSAPIRTWREPGDIAEQSSDDIWRAVATCTRAALAKAALTGADIAGIGFDATCSLVVLGEGGQPLPVGTHGDPARNVILWMDHRATEQAERINATGHRVLDYVGGALSPEMETPKLLWLKENLPQTWQAAHQFMDLADFLTWRATGSLDRSVCTVTCKWTYLAHEDRWDPGYFDTIGLGDLAQEGFARIGTTVVPAGTAQGRGLTQQAADDLGLLAGTPVGAGLIDAHAGGIGSLGGGAENRIAYVMGTSACTMASSAQPRFIPGVWGPYLSAMVPGLWLSEGGQSTAGAAIERVLALHPAAPALQAEAQALGQSLPDLLADRAAASAASLSEAVRLTAGLIVIPDFLGNRAPHADPQARGLIAGLDMSGDADSLRALYVAAVTGLGYGLRQIIAASRAQGAQIDALVISGGAGRHPVVRQLLADATGLPVEIPRSPEPVLLGAAILGATAAGLFADIGAAMTAMSPVDTTVAPATGAVATLHAARFAAYETLQRAEAQARAHLAATGEGDS